MSSQRLSLLRLSRIRSAVLNLMLLAVSALVALVCSEMVIRYVAPQKLYRFPQGMFAHHTTLEHRLTPHFRGTASTSEYRTRIHINGLGLREDRDYGEKPADTYRVLALGDSFTMGVGVEVEQTYVKVLERVLASKSRNQASDVINAGVPGYNTRQALVYLQEEGLQLNPDLILLNFYVGNDIHDNFDSRPVRVVDGYLQDKTSSASVLPYAARLFLSRNSHLYNFVWPYQRRLVDWLLNRPPGPTKAQLQEAHLAIYAVPEEDDRAQAMWQATQQHLVALKEIVADRKVAVVIIPELIQAEPWRWSAIMQEQVNSIGAYQRDYPNKRIVDICLQLGLPVLDLLPTLTRLRSSEPLYFELDGHWTRKGNALVAEAVYAFLRAEALIPGMLGS